jgi:hypothetical protein
VASSALDLSRPFISGPRFPQRPRIEDFLMEPRIVRRDANIGIAGMARDLDFSARIPFLCECDDGACHGIARISLDAFDVIETQTSWSLIGDAHEMRAGVVDGASKRTILELPSLAA